MPTRLERLIAIDCEIRSGRFPNVADLCQLFSVKPRTVYDDIKVLRERLGFDIRFDRLRNGYFNACPSRCLPAFELSQTEAVLLGTGLYLLVLSIDGRRERTELALLIRKVRQRLPADVVDAFDLAVSGTGGQ